MKSNLYIRPFLNVCLQSSQLREELFLISKDLLIITDMAGNISAINHMAKDMLGYFPEELHGKSLACLFDSDDREVLYRNLLFLAKKGEGFDDEIMLLKKNMTPFFVNLTMKPIRNEYNGKGCILFSIKDIDRWKRLENELKRFHYKELVKIANGIAHEIRNPLTALGGFMQRLYKSCEKYYYNKKEYGYILYNLRRIENIIKKVDFFVRPEPPCLEECNLLELLNDALMSYMDEIKRRGIDIKIETVDLILRVDPELIKRVFSILIENALDAMEGEGCIEVKFKQESDSALIVFKDTGKGIQEDDLPFIFHPFFSTKPKGAGIDLAILKKIIHDHGGRVEVESTLGVGTSFKIFLPFERRRPIRVERWED